MRRVAVEAVKYGKGNWMKRMSSCGREFGWQEVGAEQVKNVRGGVEGSAGECCVAESEGRME